MWGVWKAIYLQKVLLSILLIALTTQIVKAQLSETEMRTVLEIYDREALLLCNKNVKANWAVATDLLNEELVVEQVSLNWIISKSSTKFPKSAQSSIPNHVKWKIYHSRYREQLPIVKKIPGVVVYHLYSWFWTNL